MPTIETINNNLNINRLYTKQEIEELFNTNFGARIKGITLRRDSEDKQYIILFHVAGSIYDDGGTKNDFVYFGEGANGDQKLTAANKALIDSIQNGRPIFGFWQEDSSLGFEYIGQLNVNSYEYTLHNNRKVYKFRISSNS
jgi:hypothetical protein